MASTRQLKSRIRSVGNTKQITRAMQMVAASKMRRAQELTKASAPYTAAGNNLLSRLSVQTATDNHPLFTKRKIKTRLIVLIAGDKGLAGAYNFNVFKKYIELLYRDDERGIANQTITVGRKASQFAARLKDTEILGSYDNIPDQSDGLLFRTILDTVTEAYRNQEVDAVTVVYTEFINSINQRAELMRLLPAGTEAFSDPTEVVNADEVIKYEPSPQEVLDGVAYRMVGARVYQALLDSRASEHSMRMVAMKNATDNASDLIDDLTLAMNKARQSAITQELAEISGGAEALAN